MEVGISIGLQFMAKQAYHSLHCGPTPTIPFHYSITPFHSREPTTMADVTFQKAKQADWNLRTSWHWWLLGAFPCRGSRCCTTRWCPSLPPPSPSGPKTALLSAGGQMSEPGRGTFDRNCPFVCPWFSCRRRHRSPTFPHLSGNKCI